MVARPMSLVLPGLEPDPPAPVASATDPEGALHELFGFPVFRRGQREAVEGTRATHCDACFSGEYPLAETEDSAQGKDAFERALPLVRA
jgi:hypothetical protein